MRPYRPAAYEKLLWSGSLVRFGSFSVSAEDPAFATAGQMRSHPAVVFPRTDAVWIEQEGHRPVLADRNCVMLYNLHQSYRRSPAAGREDRAEFFHFDERALDEALVDGLAPRLASSRPFSVPRLPVDDLTCALERAIVRYVKEDPLADPLLVEEVLLRVLRRVFSPGSLASSNNRWSRRRALAEEARALLAATFTEGHSVAALAAELGCTAFHLCRTFRDVVGMTLHSYRMRLRLRASLERVAESGETLTRIAFDLGFASHSHFTARFGRVFGMPPSTMRKSATPHLIERLTRRVAPSG